MKQPFQSLVGRLHGVDFKDFPHAARQRCADTRSNVCRGLGDQSVYGWHRLRPHLGTQPRQIGGHRVQIERKVNAFKPTAAQIYKGRVPRAATPLQVPGSKNLEVRIGKTSNDPSYPRGQTARPDVDHLCHSEGGEVRPAKRQALLVSRVFGICQVQPASSSVVVLPCHQRVSS
jgi:hypothetical protein